MKVMIFRLASSAILVITSIVVLGISAHVESSVRQFNLSTGTFTFDAFLGAFTTFVEVVLALTRWLTNSSINGVGAELGIQLLLWVMWLAAGIATTVRTEADRGFCKNLGDFENSPELEGIDPAFIAAAKKILKSACSEIHAEVAFIWISFVISTVIALHLFLVGTRAHKRIGRVAWRTHLATMDHASTAPVDPFADPAGAVAGPSVGVVGAPYDEDPDRK